MDIKAQLNNLRMAPRKVRAVSNLIKGKNVLDAANQLEVAVKRSSLPIMKLLKSAIANAESNHNLAKENLYVKSIIVNEGVKLKRFKPKGFGRVSPIEKKTSHIKLILAERIPGLKRAVQSEKKDILTKEVTKQEFKKTTGGEIRQGRPEIKTELGKKEGVLKSLGRRMFRRKAI